MDNLRQRIKTNLNRIRGAIADAAARSGRSEGDVRLVAVTKAVAEEEIAALAALGQRDLGENRVEQLLPRTARARAAGLDVRWHMIGHLQRRKVRDLLPEVALIHGVDSLRLAEEIDKRAAAAALPAAAVLLEVNVSGEEQKYGLRPDELPEVLRQAAALRHVEVRGLMTMAPLSDDAELSRPVFRALRELCDRLNEAGVYPRPLAELSMGMSQDYAVAVEEGATLVRVGTALFV
ncbi:MAG: YggS family pyridoxal phosphate-dependent enzyme [Sedimentisphaerales bacterium]|nr:YggS family pyridoxal phosphate-dependent enzyme [Sedimentisphaerales bacterium]